MEEVEALCTRLVVMVSGRAKCIGTAQHLKNKFGGGYQVELRCAVNRVDDCLALCSQLLGVSMRVEEQHAGFVRMFVKESPQLSVVFRELESRKVELELFDYSVSQCSLEQIFIQFAAEQEEERGHVRGMITTTTEAAAASVDASSLACDNEPRPLSPYENIASGKPYFSSESAKALLMT